MANPNKTVAKARRQMGGFAAREPKPVGYFVQWIAEQAREGVTFETLQEAEAAFALACPPPVAE